MAVTYCIVPGGDFDACNDDVHAYANSHEFEQIDLKPWGNKNPVSHIEWELMSGEDIRVRIEESLEDMEYGEVSVLSLIASKVMSDCDYVIVDSYNPGKTTVRSITTGVSPI